MAVLAGQSLKNSNRVKTVLQIAVVKARLLEPVSQNNGNAQQDDDIQRCVDNVSGAMTVDVWLPTNDAKDGGEDAVEVHVGIVTEGAHAARLLGRHQCIGTCRVLLERRRSGVEVATAIELGEQSA